jgi:hypothetical protein
LNRFVLLFLLVSLSLTACDDGHLRGSVVPSSDGKTYLSVVDDNGGECGPLTVDGQPWTYPIGQPGPIQSGRHKISCGTEIEFIIPSGVVFSFDYWGP